MHEERRPADDAHRVPGPPARPRSGSGGSVERPAGTRGAPDGRAVAQLQRAAGNRAVAHLLGRTAPRPADPAPAAEPALQRHIKNKSYVEYGGTNADGLGTTMVSEFWPSKPPGAGTKPSVEPAWWPHPPDIAAPFFRNYMVQGHLLNQQIGGPGNTMDNLTPITKSANTMHEKKVENAVKQHVKSGNYVVDYHVYGDYKTSPAADELAPNEPTAVQNHIAAHYAPKLPGKIVAEFTAWNQLAGGGWVQLGDRWKIGNEGKEIT